MKILVVTPGLRAIEYALFADGEGVPVVQGSMEIDGMAKTGADRLDRIVQKAASGAGEPDTIAFHAAFGGPAFDGPVMASPAVLAELRKNIPSAPLHLPVLLSLLPSGGSRRGRPVVLAFDTAFFTGLDRRENSYALETGLMREMALRRYGFHGLLHEAACRRLVGDRREADGPAPRRIMSFCLEPRPEAAAVLDLKPVTVTGGSTPLEGLPGERTCGDLDPGVVLTIASELKWGPEQINQVLMRTSGLFGLLGRPVEWGSLFRPEDRASRTVRDLLFYRLLLVCGSGIAAMGGLDAMAFSGRYAAVGRFIGPWLVARLEKGMRPGVLGKVVYGEFTDSVERVVADMSLEFLSDRIAGCTSGH